MEIIIRRTAALAIALGLLSHTGCNPQKSEPATFQKTKKKPEAVTKENPAQDPLALVKTGITEKRLIELLGEPRGAIASGSKTTIMYDDVQILVEDGMVKELPPDFAAKFKAGKSNRAKREAQRAEQKKTGFAQRIERWIGQKNNAQPKLVTQRTAQPYPVAKPKSVVKQKPYVMKNGNGQVVDHSRLVRRGKVTVVDFYANWCGPCKALAPELEKLMQKHRDVAFEKVNIRTWESSVVKQYSVSSVPNIRVFDRRGDMVAPPTSNIKKIEANIKLAKKR